jgi:hypothetical protein
VTDTRDRLIYLALLPALAVLGLLVVDAPLLAVGAVGALYVPVALSRGTSALFVGSLFVFPLVPSSVQFGIASLYPQRLLLGLMLLVLLADRDLWAEHSWRIGRVATPLRLLAAFIAAGLISAAGSPLPTAALGGAGFYALHVLGAFAIGLLFARREMSHHYYIALSLAAIAVALVSFLEYAFPGNILTTIYKPEFANGHFAADQTRALATRASGPAGNPVALGTYALMTLPFVLRAAAHTHKVAARLGQVAVVAILATMLLSQTRMALLAAPVALIVWLTLAGGQRKRVTLVIAATAVIGVGIFGASTLQTQGEILGQALSYRGQQSAADPAFNSIVARSSIYTTGWNALRDRPLLGFGYRLPTQHAQSPIFTRYGQPYAFESYAVALPVEAGLIGTALFVLAAAALIAAAIRFLSRPDRATVAAALVASAVLAIGANPFDVPVSYLWLLLGMVFGTGLARTASVVESEMAS